MNNYVHKSAHFAVSNQKDQNLTIGFIILKSVKTAKLR